LRRFDMSDEEKLIVERRIADGPDEVHKNSLARTELGRYK
jgi:hypothetical protein